jgi:hypothetical protein
MGETAAKQIWHQRLDRAIAEQGQDGRRMMADWAHELLAVLSVGPQHNLELVGPWGHRHWAPIPPERMTEEYKAQETRRLWDELGERLGIGPKP